MRQPLQVQPGGPVRDPETVIAAYVRLRQVSRREICHGKVRSHSVVWPRHELSWLLHDLTPLVYREIGMLTGGRDTASVMHSIARVADRMAEDPDWREAVVSARQFILNEPPAGKRERPDNGAMLARRVLGAGGEASDLAVMMLTLGSVLRNGELTDAEARSAALAVIAGPERSAP
jgi:hypothetical protein